VTEFVRFRRNVLAVSLLMEAMRLIKMIKIVDGSILNSRKDQRSVVGVTGGDRAAH
jgi:hypothetical protein